MMPMADWQMDYSERPYSVIWETTRPCDLIGAQRRSCAQPQRDARELSTEEARRLIDEIAALQVPMFVLSGSDPLKRPDILELVEYATSQGVRTSMMLSVTPLLTQAAIAKLKRRGLARLAVSLDGSTSALHDSVRDVPGSHQQTIRAIQWASELGLPVQVNTTITRRNVTDVEAMARLLERLEVVLWNVFFPVPVGRSEVEELISAEEFETVFQQLYESSQRVRFEIRTSEAPHYRRYVLQRRAEELRRRVLGSVSVRVGALHAASGSILRDAVLAFLSSPCSSDGIQCAPRGLNDDKGCVFVSYRGEVYPGGSLPLSAGSIRKTSLAEIYQGSPLFVTRRDSTQLEGKCRICEFSELCGGSRARAFAMTGNPFA
jgi:AdoMet-dependent heme synthase